MSESFAELFEQSLKSTKIAPGGLIVGEIMRIENNHVVVDVGLKSEGVIPLEQFKDTQGELTIKVGDRIDVVLEYMENGHGETQLSREKAQRARAWDELDKAFEAQSIVKGVITEKVKGGFTVLVDSVRAFLPGSLVDVRPVRDSTYLEGKELEFKVIKLDRKRNNVVVSRRAVVETEISAERDSLLSNLQEGQIIKGVVKNLKIGRASCRERVLFEV